MAPVYEELLWDLLMFLARYGHQSISALEHWPITKVYAAANSLARVMAREGKGGGFHENAATGGA